MTTGWNSNFQNKTIPFSDTSVQVALAANAVQTFTVPGAATQKYQALFSYTSTSNVFIGYNFTPTTPAPGTHSANGQQEFRPDCRYVHGGDVLSFLTPDTTGYVGVSLRAIPG
jgi:hypothetical protein